MRILTSLLAALALAISMSAQAAPCGGFTDVDGSNPGIVPFCASVEWIRNRGVTLGCETNLYCPSNNVSRLQMAAFLKRLGDVLIHRLVLHGQVVANLDLTSEAAISMTNPQQPAAYERRAALSVSVSAASNGAGPATFAVIPVYTSDDGTTFNAGGGQTAQATSADATTWVNVSNFSSATMDAGVAYRFAIIVQGVGGTTALANVRCTLSADIRHKDIDD